MYMQGLLAHDSDGAVASVNLSLGEDVYHLYEGSTGGRFAVFRPLCVVEQSHHESITSGPLAMQEKEWHFDTDYYSNNYTDAGCLQQANTSRDRGIEDLEAKHYHINTGLLSASNTKRY